jgi:hypothetical protein
MNIEIPEVKYVASEIGLHETLFPHPSVIRTALLFKRKIIMLYGQFPQNMIPQVVIE